MLNISLEQRVWVWKAYSFWRDILGLDGLKKPCIFSLLERTNTRMLMLRKWKWYQRWGWWASHDVAPTHVDIDLGIAQVQIYGSSFSFSYKYFSCVRPSSIFHLHPCKILSYPTNFNWVAGSIYKIKTTITHD